MLTIPIQFIYLLIILLSLAGLFIIDKRYKLVFLKDSLAAIKTFVILYLVLIGWDLLGIKLGIFFPGDSKFTLNIEVLPSLPIEELFFLGLLIYVALIIFNLKKS